ncbi:MAG: hypothetical protein HY661_08735 [Betaproteobacteria bacterium]|nr:hypothetical protein [Betaproteobacteria bacterium]
MVARVIPLKKAAGKRQAELIAQGWTKQTTIGEPRLSELVENYKALGYEVEVVEQRGETDGCGICFDAGGEMGVYYADIWLRKKAGAKSEQDDLF